MNDTNKPLAQQITERLAALKMSKEALARQLNVSLGTIHRWTKGTSAPRGLNDLAKLKAWLAANN